MLKFTCKKTHTLILTDAPTYTETDTIRKIHNTLKYTNTQTYVHIQTKAPHIHVHAGKQIYTYTDIYKNTCFQSYRQT